MRKASLTIIAWALLLFARTAQAQLIDNGNGTVSDGKTGLMWEKKTPAATGGVHNVEERYTWSVAARAGQMQPDGTVFTLFLASLNGKKSTGCFANHCDWRLPSLDELKGILTPSCPKGPCSDPKFGPTELLGVYWSATSVDHSPDFAWGVNFSQGLVWRYNKDGLTWVRAVRSGS